MSCKGMNNRLVYCLKPSNTDTVETEGFGPKNILGATSANDCRADWHFLRCLPSGEDRDGAWSLAWLLFNKNFLKAYFEVRKNKRCICVRENFSLRSSLKLERSSFDLA